MVHLHVHSEYSALDGVSPCSAIIERAAAIGSPAVALTDQAISTSGDNEKFFKDAQGRRLGHIFDPKTGWPVQHDVASVSVVGPDSMTAGATATTLFVLGQEAGLKYIEARPTMAALFIVRDAQDKFRQVPSSRFAEMTKP